MRRLRHHSFLAIVWLALAFQALLPMGVMPGSTVSGGGLLQLCPGTYPLAVLEAGSARHQHHQEDSGVTAEPPECEFGLLVPGAAALDVYTAQNRATGLIVSFHPRHASPVLIQYDTALARAPPAKQPG